MQCIYFFKIRGKKDKCISFSFRDKIFMNKMTQCLGFTLKYPRKKVEEE